ncbi:ornithine decarboxylase [Catellatospora sp. TT07R-123]|uniref:type III PLP-dependent enzyme n=1 Tax=Catellatospora sp. TT07R-123 TaxID=2733863 RepID=UPI001B05218E|nr:type III PLP-dependent enzyme [Catellatospora sp. TT07R-123]GHJ48710.1 ornithine decarboxylase [Catellatospora sp. TT07R-123]
MAMTNGTTLVTTFAAGNREIQDFLDTTRQETPYLVIDTKVGADKYLRLTGAFRQTQVFYAVKANPQPKLIRHLARLGSSFDVASPAEIDLCLSEGADPGRLSYGNTIKKASDIRYAYDRGVRLFVFDSEAELRKIAEHAPGSSVFCRLLAASDGAQWPLSRKFGCTPDMAVELLDSARRLGLVPVGISFHVGSQQLDPTRWEPSIAQAAGVFRELAGRGVNLWLLDVGGGFPTGYQQPVAPIEEYAEAIEGAVDRHFADLPVPHLAVEPGRYIAADTGVLRAQVVLVSQKSYEDDHRWVYLDIGRFGGLAETEGEAIQYRLVTARDGEPSGPVKLAGPTCDSVDILYEKAPYRLPLDLQPGDYVDILGTGAYTTTYSSVGFNGFAPLATFCIGDGA